MLNETDDMGLGGFKFKKIFKSIKKIAPIVFPVVMLPKLLKKGGKILKGMGKMFSPKGGGAGAAGAEYVPTQYDESGNPIGPGYMPQGQGSGGPGEFGPESSQGGIAGMLGGLSPLTIGLMVGAPVLLILLMKKK